VQLEALSVAGSAVDTAEARVSIANRRDPVTITYSSPELSGRAGLEFRYRLVGFDHDWVNAGPSRAAHYGNLPAGEYDFLVSARRRGGAFSAPLRLLSIDVAPRWFETFGARSAFGLGIGLLVYGLHRLRLLHLRRSEKLLKQKVAERTVALEAEVAERQSAEARAKELAEKLEHRVQERTAELELARLAAKRSEERYALAVRGAEDGLWDWDLAGGFIYFSPRWKELLGYADHELASHLDAWFAHVHPEDLFPVLLCKREGSRAMPDLMARGGDSLPIALGHSQTGLRDISLEHFQAGGVRAKCVFRTGDLTKDFLHPLTSGSALRRTCQNAYIVTLFEKAEGKMASQKTGCAGYK